jgi:hypothetical protein
LSTSWSQSQLTSTQRWNHTRFIKYVFVSIQFVNSQALKENWAGLVLHCLPLLLTRTMHQHNADQSHICVPCSKPTGFPNWHYQYNEEKERYSGFPCVAHPKTK